MDIEKEILAVRSKEQVAKLVKWVGKDKMRFQKLMELFLHGEDPLAKKSAWIVGHCAESNPELVSPWLKPMINKMQEPEVHDAVKRNVVRILQFVDIPRRLQGIVANLCFELISSIDEPIAVRTFSMTVLAKIAQEEPDLKKELEIAVRQMLPYATPAFRVRAKKVLKNHEIDELIASPEEEWGMEHRMIKFRS
jgi:hypothetical protein